jgi:hypothetical protein
VDLRRKNDLLMRAAADAAERAKAAAEELAPLQAKHA